MRTKPSKMFMKMREQGSRTAGSMKCYTKRGSADGVSAGAAGRQVALSDFYLLDSRIFSGHLYPNLLSVVPTKDFFLRDSVD